MALMTLQFADTRVSVLVIRQSVTYGGVYEGQKSARLNQRVLDMAVEKGEQLWPGLPVVVLHPVTLEGSQNLPQVQCLSLLQSDQPIATIGGDISRLVLLHYEHEVSPHYSDSTKRQIASFKWCELASNCEL